MEYIEREAAKKAFCDYCDWAEAGSEYCQSCPDPVGKIPAADVAPVRWIPVTERLPDDGSYLVLCRPTTKVGKPYVSILSFNENLESVDEYDFEGKNRSGWYYYDGEYGYIEVNNVTHWQLLPEPPKEET